MKNIIATVLVILGTSQAMALSIDQVSCSDGHGSTLSLSRDTIDTLRGVFHRGDMTAEIECERGGWGPLTYQRPISCLGRWVLGSGGISIQLELLNLPLATADVRGDRLLNCQVEF